ncbi:hypothetical protein M5G07_08960 [Serratia symbiotica]|nr:hypothetical protein [Serratia symbiotica]
MSNCRWRDFTEVNKGISTISQVDGHKAATADIAAAWVDHCLRVANRHHSIYHVAAHF